MARVASPTAPAWWPLGALLAVGLGAAAAFSLTATVAGVAVALLTWLFTRAKVKSELVVALFWTAFCLYETVFSEVTLQGLFYPFYAAFVVSVVLALARSGVRFDPAIIWLYGAFLMVVAVSLLGFDGRVDFQVIQRLFAYVFGLLVALQFGSRRGLRPVLGAAVLTGLAISIWVIDSSFRVGFAYRGGVSVDQNVVTFFIGFGAVVLLAAILNAMGRADGRGRVAWLVLLLGVMLYAVMLLASRGLTIALLVAGLAIVARTILFDPRRVGIIAVVAVLGVSTLLLPGGDSLLERFALQDTETANNRLPIWEHVLESYADGNPVEVVLGHGFNSSHRLVLQLTGMLTSTHNAFLQILYEFGALGLVLFLALHALLLVRAYRIGDGNGVVMFGLLWFLIASNLSINAPDGFMYWTALGVTMALGLWTETPTTDERLAQEG